jgi:hypothetical protein
LSTAVGVQFVEDDELESICIRDHLSISLALASHQQLKHHEVGEQDVWFSMPN